MLRRHLLGSMSLAAAATAAPGFRLRYGPAMGWLGANVSVPEHMRIYAEAGFTAFEFNGLPRHTMSEIEGFRKKRDELKLSMGTLVVNRGGWRATAMNDPARNANAATTRARLRTSPSL